MGDTSLDSVWSFFHSSNEIGGSLSESFNVGIVITNGERHSTSGDIAWSHFDGLQYETGSGWSDWSNASCFTDNDPDYSNHIMADNNIYVDVRSGSC